MTPCARVNPKLVLCSITGYGQDGPLRDRAGHDMNYLALTGVLGLTGEPGGPPVQAAGPDRRPRRRRADGGVRDPRGAARGRAHGGGAGRRRRDGRRRAVVAGARRGALSQRRRRAGPAGARDARAGRRPGLLPALRLRRRRLGGDGRAGAEVLGGVVSRRRTRGSDRRAVRRARQRGPRRGRGGVRGRARAPSGRRSPPSTSAAWSRCSTSARRSSSEHVRARGMVAGLDQPGAARPVSLLGAPVKLSRTPADCNRLPGPELGEHTEAVLRAAGYDAASGSRSCSRDGAVAGPPDAARGRRRLVPRVGARSAARAAPRAGYKRRLRRPPLKGGRMSDPDDEPDHPDRRRDADAPLRQRGGRDHRRRRGRDRHDRRRGRRADTTDTGDDSGDTTDVSDDSDRRH